LRTFSGVCALLGAALVSGHSLGQSSWLAVGRTPQGSGSALLEGTAAWDQARVVKWARILGHTIVLPPTYPNQAMTAQLNPEFVKRLDVVVALYRAINNKEIGIVPGSGGLRTVQTQKELYRKGRRIKDSLRTNKKGRDGSLEDDWELRTDNNRGQPLYEQVPVVDKNGKPVLDKKGNQTYRNGRQIGWPGEWDPDQKRFITVTNAWGPEGWHAYGAAADFVEFVNGRATWPSPSIFKSAEWYRAAALCGQLGLRFGVWFQGGALDPPHVEYHPKLPDVPTSIPGTANGTGTFAAVAVAPGTALTAAQTDAGYAWKLPRTIYHWWRDFGDDSGLQRLEVFELDFDSEWIRLKRYREIVRQPLSGAAPAGWSGTWVTYDPPARFFPVFSETMTRAWEPAVYAEDAALRARSTITVTKHFEIPGATAGFAKEIRQQAGEAALLPRGYVNDLLMQGWMYRWMHNPDEVRWEVLRKSRIYDVDATLEEDRERESSDVQEKVRTIDEFGKTEDRTSNGPISPPFVKLDFCWNRETGAIGVLQPYTTDKPGPYELRDVRMMPGAGIGEMVISRLPQGAFDRENPPITLGAGNSGTSPRRQIAKRSVGAPALGRSTAFRPHP